MTQYLIRTIEHNGETFTDVITVRDNERYQVVEADSKEQAERKARDKIQCPSCRSWNTVHAYSYDERNEPEFLIFECINCKYSYSNYIKKGQ